MSNPQKEAPNARIRELIESTPTPVRRAKTLETVFVSSPVLFEKTSDIEALKDGQRIAISGIGLSWAKYNNETESLEHGLSTGLPVDVMSYLATIGQRHKHAPDAPKTIFLVSDYFAQGLPGITQEELKKTTDTQIETLTKIASRLQIQGTGKTLLDCLDIRRVSEDVAANQGVFDHHYRNLAHHENDYERRQTAAIAMYREVNNASVKISYAFEDAGNPSGKKDERSFDTLSGDYGATNDMSFVYVDIGRSTETKAAKACPYITSKSQETSRLMLGDKTFADQIAALEQRVSEKTGRSGKRDRDRLSDIKSYFSGLGELVDATFTVIDDSDVIMLPNITGSFDKGIQTLQDISNLTRG